MSLNETNDQTTSAPKEDEISSSNMKGQNNLFVRIDQNSSDNLQELFDSVLNPEYKRPLQVPFRMRKLPNSFFNPPASTPSKTTTVSHSRANSADSAYDAGSQSNINQAAAAAAAAPSPEKPVIVPSPVPQVQLSANGLPICHSRAHSSPASLQQTYKLHANNTENTTCNQEAGSFVGGVNTVSFAQGPPPPLDRLKQSVGGPPNVFHMKQRSYDVISPIQLQNEFGALPPGWEQAKTNDGQIYYLNHITKTTQWEDPRIQLRNQANAMQQGLTPPANVREANKETVAAPDDLGPLPEGWEQALTESGDVYFINHNNRTTSWNDPRISDFLQKSIKATKSDINWLNARTFEKDQELFKHKLEQNPLVRHNPNLQMDPFLSGDSHARQESGDSGLSLSSNTFSIATDFVPQMDDSMDGLSEAGSINHMNGLDCPDNLVSSLQLGDDICNEMFTDVQHILNSSNNKPDNLEWYKIN